MFFFFFFFFFVFTFIFSYFVSLLFLFYFLIFHSFFLVFFFFAMTTVKPVVDFLFGSKIEKGCRIYFLKTHPHQYIKPTSLFIEV